MRDNNTVKSINHLSCVSRYSGARSVLLSIAVVMCLSMSANSRANESAKHFDIREQPLAQALMEFGTQSGLTVVVPSALTSGKTVTPIRGDMPPTDALRRLLAGSGLTFTVGEGGTIAVHSPSAIPPIASVRPGKTNAPLREASGAEPVKKSDGESGAGEESTKRETLEEVVVTAQKRAERLQEVPIAISVLRGDYLDKSTAEGITETLSRVPGVATNLSPAGVGTQVSVRGVTAGSGLFNGSSPIGYYLDSVPFGLVKTAITPDSNAYDLERVEVLRGPQGTLYGASAENGVVRILTRDANLSRFEFKARMLGSDTQDGGGNYRGDVAINVPIIEGRLAARAVVGYQSQSGWIDRPGNPDANDGQLRNYRLKVNAQPTDELSIGLSAWSARDDYGAPPLSANGRTNPSLVNESITTDYDAYGLKIGYDLPAFTVSSMTSYLDYSNAGQVDLTELFFALPNLFTGLKAHVFAEEVNMSSKPGATWKWSGGAIYRDGKDRLNQNNLGGGAPYDYTNASESFAVFGEIGRRFMSGQLEWTLGLRYFHDHVLVQENVNQGPPGSTLIHSTDSFNPTTPRAVLTWYPNQDMTVYGSYSEGFRSGFHQDPIVARAFPEVPALKPDKLHNYEIGTKADLWSHRLSLESAIYYIKWDSVQQQLVIPTQGTFTTAMINGQSASGVGVDLGLTARPADGLEFGINASWNDLAMDSPVISSGVVLFDKGDRLNLSPRYTVGAQASYAFPLGSSGLTGRFSASSNYISKQDQRTTFGPAVVMGSGDSMLIARASAAVDSPNRWTVTLFVDNLNNEQGAVTRPTLPIPDWVVRVRPRTVGLQVEYRFQ